VEKPLGRPTHGWKDNIKTDLKEMACKSVNWIDLAQDKWQTPMNMVINLWVQYKSGDFYTS
jgi:hypothetical protein